MPVTVSGRERARTTEGLGLGRGKDRAPAAEPADSGPGAAPALLATWVAAAIGALVVGSTLVVGDAATGAGSGRALVAVQSVAACCSMLLVLLLLARVRRTRRLKDWRLATGVALLGVVGWLVKYGVEIVAPPQATRLAVWGAEAVRLVGVGFIVLSAGTSASRRVGRSRVLTGAGLTAASLALLVALGWLVRRALPDALDYGPSTAVPRELPTQHPWLEAALTCTAALLLVAALEFAAQSRHGQDPVVRALGPACMLGAFAHLQYLAVPTLYTTWLSSADALWFASCLTLVMASAGEVKRYYSLQCRREAVRARRSFARELHDGVIQELAFLRAAASTRETVDRRMVVEACDRALLEARTALHTVVPRSDRGLVSALEPHVRELGGRYGVAVGVRLDDAVAAPPGAAHDVVRIVGEAMANAVRHGHASRIDVSLLALPGGRARLTVRDDGGGFTRSQPIASPGASGGYGLSCMRERAMSFGADFDVRSTPGRGTEVEITW
ncbi:sensor histidine kinase [Nocardioides caldifontis]|uniref:sensor histidine kinase n=1 Tax=Nocardioides caldifontis TaxID=2588938 RepID=UPI0011E022C2|nr:ATP-binding protein [Nocardioides caldifontis]